MKIKNRSKPREDHGKTGDCSDNNSMSVKAWCIPNLLDPSDHNVRYITNLPGMEFGGEDLLIMALL
jgi:hypothetical protein